MSSEENEKDELIQEVFRIKHSDIPKGITQCQKHKWEKLNDNEIICRVCMSAAIIDPKQMQQYAKSD